jgi:hypothetical protein
MIKLYQVYGPYEDPYTYLTLNPNYVKNCIYRNLDILEIESVYHFFECVNIEENPENAKDIFNELINLWEDGKIKLI